MHTEEKRHLVYEAQAQMLDALAMLKDAARDDEWARRTIIANLETVITREHTWMGRDANLDDWLDRLDDEASEDEGEDEKDEGHDA